MIENMDIQIENADIFLAGVALSNVYINKDHLLFIGKSLRDSQHIIEKRLNDKTKSVQKHSQAYWSAEFRDSKQFDELSKSHSAYRLITKREYVATCRLEPIRFHEDVVREDRLERLDSLKEDVNCIYGLENYQIEDVELRFYEYGNVTISGRVKIRDLELSKEDYFVLSEFSHALFGPALKKQVCELVQIYADVMLELDKDKDVDLYLLRVPVEMNKTQESGFLIEEHALNFAIRDHFIYDSKLLETEGAIQLFRDVLTGEWEPAINQVVRLSDAAVYSGWTHSMFLLPDYHEELSSKLYSKYKFPLEVVIANWGALDSLSKRLDRARALFIRDIEEMEGASPAKRDFNQIAKDIREFTLKIERILESFDSYTVSNNPMHYKLIDLQQDAWMESKSVEKIRRKVELVTKIVDELSTRQKSLEAEKLSKALFTITFLTVIEISKVIFEILTSKKSSLLSIAGIFVLLLIMVALVYLGFFNGKKRSI